MTRIGWDVATLRHSTCARQSGLQPARDGGYSPSIDSREKHSRDANANIALSSLRYGVHTTHAAGLKPAKASAGVSRRTPFLAPPRFPNDQCIATAIPPAPPSCESAAP